jgi:tripartite-type tricarboxylate transporter receptor subunit TctC
MLPTRFAQWVLPTLILCHALMAQISAQGAEVYPNKPIKMLVGATPGASSDTYARIISDQLGKVLGQAVVIENKTGASGLIAMGGMVQTGSDGYTMQLTYTPHTLSPALFKKLTFDPIKDVTGVTMVVTSPLVLVVGQNSKIKTLKDLLDLAKDRPLNFGSAGIGSGGHLSGEMLRLDTHIQTSHIPYRGAAPAAAAVVAGDVDFAFVAQITAKELATANKLKILAVTSKTRSPSLPQIPTMQELGLRDFEFLNWFGVVMAAKTPPEIIKTVHQGIMEVLKTPSIRARLTEDGSEIIGNTPEQFTAFINSDAAKWSRLAVQMGLKGD